MNTLNILQAIPAPQPSPTRPDFVDGGGAAGSFPDLIQSKLESAGVAPQDPGGANRPASGDDATKTRSSTDANHARRKEAAREQAQDADANAAEQPDSQPMDSAAASQEQALDPDQTKPVDADESSPASSLSTPEAQDAARHAAFWSMLNAAPHPEIAREVAGNPRSPKGAQIASTETQWNDDPTAAGHATGSRQRHGTQESRIPDGPKSTAAREAATAALQGRDLTGAGARTTATEPRITAGSSAMASAEPHLLSVTEHATAGASAIVSTAAAAAADATHATDALRPPVTARIDAPIDDARFPGMLALQVTTLVKQGVSEARLQLHPAEMGPVAVQIAVDGARAHVSFIAASDVTCRILQDSLPQLASALNDSGLMLDGGGVFQQPGDSQQSAAQAEPDGARGVPRADTLSATAEPASAPARRTAHARGMLDLFA